MTDKLLQPPYYAVIFSSTRTPGDNGYAQTAARIAELARRQPGFLGVESARDDNLGITVSYWDSLKAIAAWRRDLDHAAALARGRGEWYESYDLKVAKVEKAVRFGPKAEDGQ